MRIVTGAFFCDNAGGEEVWTLNTTVYRTRKEMVDHVKDFLTDTLGYDPEDLTEEMFNETLNDFLRDKRSGADCQLVFMRYGNNWMISLEEMSL